MSADPVRTVFARLNRGPDAPDAELLALYAADRNEAAFAALVRRHGPMVQAVCRRLAPADADDAFQAVFFLLSRKAGTLTAPDRLGPWLHGVARRVARKAAQRRGRERIGGPLPEVAVSDPPADDLRAAVHEEVGRLPEAYRVVVLLCDLEGVPRRAAASRLGIPDGTLNNRLTRARAMLGRRLVRRGIGLSGLAAVGPGLVPGELVAASVAAVRTPPAAVLALTGGGGAIYGWLMLAGLAAVAVGLTVCRPVADPPAPPKPVAAVADPMPIAGERGEVANLAVTPDGRHLYVIQWEQQFNLRQPVPPARITVFDTATWRVVRRLVGPDAVCGPVCFHPGGRVAYVVHPGRTAVHRVEVETWKTLGVLDPDAGFVCFALSPDGQQLATSHFEARVGKPRLGQPGLLTLWDAITFARQRELVATVPASVGAYKPDGSAVAVAYTEHDGTAAGVIEFDPRTGAERQRLPVEVEPPGRPIIVAVAYTPDGRQLLAAGGAATPVVGATNQLTMSGRAWRLDHLKRQMVRYAARDDGRYYSSLAVSPDGRHLYLGGTSQTLFNGPRKGNTNWLGQRSKVQAWRTDNAIRTDWAADGELGAVTALCPLPGGDRLVVADAGGVWLFDAATGKRRGGLLTLPAE